MKASVSQFSSEVRDNALMMAEHYKLFYMLENDIRRLIGDTLTEENKGPDWWDKYAPDSAERWKPDICFRLKATIQGHSQRYSDGACNIITQTSGVWGLSAPAGPGQSPGL